MCFSGALWVSLIRRPLWSEIEEREAARVELAGAPAPTASMQPPIALPAAESPAAEGRA
jgi:hypothetical protein